MSTPLASFPGSSASRADLIAAAQRLKDHPPLPFPDVVGQSADCFLGTLEQFQGDTVGELRVAVNQRIADQQALLTCGKQQQAHGWFTMGGAITAATAGMLCLNTLPLVAGGLGLVSTGLLLTSVYLTQRGASKVACANRSIEQATQFGSRLEKFGAYLAQEQPTPAPAPAPAPAPDGGAISA
jgi:hypothetical protein